MNFKIKDLNNTERPREKLLKIGVENISDAELLSIVIGNGGIDKSAINLSYELVNKYKSLNGLALLNIIELTSNKNIGIAKACSIKAAIELGVRVANFTNREIKKIEKPQDIYNFIKEKTFGKQKEHLYLISLNTRNAIISCDLISVGTVNETLLSPKEILKQALKCGAVSMILVHNHPSNNTDPSDDDIKLTRLLSNVSTQIGIALLDHVVVSDSGFTSIKSLTNLT